MLPDFTCSFIFLRVASLSHSHTLTANIYHENAMQDAHTVQINSTSTLRLSEKK